MLNYPGFTYPESHKHKPLQRQRIKISDRVYSFVGYGTSTFSVIIGNDGYSMVDAGETIEGATAALKEIKELTSLPLKNIFMTHSHIDHRGGGDVFIAENPAVTIWGRSNFGAEQAGFKGLENVSRVRAGRQFGANIPLDKYVPNSVVVKAAPGPKGAPVMPNRPVEGTVEKLDSAGIAVELYAIASETTDHMLIWLPEDKVLFCGDTMYRSLPNLYPIRGSMYRDISMWAAAVRRLLDFGANALVMGHNEPATGNEVKPLIENYAAGVQYIYDETVKGMDAGKTPDELAAEIRLPEELRELPYLGEFYGSVPWAVRSVYTGLLGWFDGNPSTLVPLAPKEEAAHMAELAGGVENLMAQATKALEQQDWRWACQLADYLLKLGDNQEAMRIKADALEELSKIVLPVSGKNYLLSSAIELRTKLAGN